MYTRIIGRLIYALACVINNIHEDVIAEPPRCLCEFAGAAQGARANCSLIWGLERHMFGKVVAAADAGGFRSVQKARCQIVGFIMDKRMLDEHV